MSLSREAHTPECKAPWKQLLVFLVPRLKLRAWSSRYLLHCTPWISVQWRARNLMFPKSSWLWTEMFEFMVKNGLSEMINQPHSRESLHWNPTKMTAWGLLSGAAASPKHSSSPVTHPFCNLVRALVPPSPARVSLMAGLTANGPDKSRNLSGIFCSGKL